LKIKIKEAKLTFITDKKFIPRDAEKLRGFFANKFTNEDLFHNHSKNRKSIFRFPLIQYKIINKKLSVFGYNEALKTISEKFLKIKDIKIDKDIIKNLETNISISDKDFFVDDNLYNYKFETIWLAVNQKNYLNFINHKLNLSKVLTNNILSNFKGLGIKVDKKIIVKGNFKRQDVNVKNNEYFGFLGNFSCNVKMPDYFGIGKHKSIGFGCIKKIN